MKTLRVVVRLPAWMARRILRLARTSLKVALLGAAAGAVLLILDALLLGRDNGPQARG